MLRRSKTLSIVMTLCLCLAMLAPVFVAPVAADAADAISYSAANTITTTTGTAAKTGLNVRVLIDVDEASVLDGTNYVTVKLPSGVELGSGSVATDVDVTKVVYDATGSATLAVVANDVNDSSFDLKVTGNSTLKGEAKIFVTFKSLKFKSGSGDIKVDFVGPSGSPFPSGTVTIGKLVSGGRTAATVSSVKNIGDGSYPIDSITIEELVAGTFKENNEIKLTLTKNFEWDLVASSKAAGGWAFETSTAITPTGDGNRDLIVKLTNQYESTSTPGKIVLSGLSVSTTNSASFGDVEVDIACSQNDNITDQTLLVAKYSDYGVTVTEGSKENVISGRTEQEIGNFTISEGVAGSLLQNRTIKLELPDGVEWIDEDNNDAPDTGKAPEIEFVDGSLTYDSWTIEDSDNQILKTTVKTASLGDAATLKIKNAEVKIKPDFEGPIEITVSGSAGAKGTVVVAEAKKPVKISAENVKDIIVGQTSQKVADIILTESDKDKIQDEPLFKDIMISLPDGYKFTAKPTVTVEEGNLEIDSVKLLNEDNDLKLVVKYASTKASKIRISNVALTAYRYVPVGAVKAELLGADFKVNDTTKAIEGVNGGSTALVDWDTDKSMGEVVIANCVTPAEGASAQFKIGSNVYTVNGVAKIMDAAPYIKDNRTYVPIRYLAYALGVTENDVVWDAATSTATFTKGDKVVVLTIGSTTMTVNGEAQTLDVAPEIVNGRTMLPARFVAEGLGSTVAWDAATSTVFVQQ